MNLDYKNIPEVIIQNWLKEKQQKTIPIDKFRTIRNFSFQKNFNFTIHKSKLNLAVIYCVWSNPLYFDLLYISLVSQFKYADAANTDIYIFVQKDLYQAALAYFKGIPVKIVSCEMLNKYSVRNNKELNKYQRLVILDCDTLFFGKKYDFYELLSRQSNDIVYMMSDPEPNALSVFKSRSVLSNIRDINSYLLYVSETIKISVAELQKMLLDKRWFLSCFLTFNQQQFHLSWEEHIKGFLDLKCWCDETVYLLYGWLRNYQFQDISAMGVEVILSSEVQLFLNRSFYNKLALVHPLHGEYCHDLGVQKLYESILNE